MNETGHKKLLEVTLGALLHDIGKLMQRAELEKAIPEIQENYDGFCPMNEHGRPGYLHAAHTAWFIEHVLPDGIIDKTELYNAARHHKNPDGDLYKTADCLSSGMERHKEETASGDPEHYKKTRMHSILEYITIEKNRMTQASYRQELVPLDDRAESCFARKVSEETNKLTRQYAQLWTGFRSEFEAIATGKPENLLVSLLGLLEKYTWCVPGSTADRPDISLYDHAKTTAAIAAALHLYHCDKGDRATANIGLQDSTTKFILLAGDISGIQNYIFNISNVGVGGTAKRLRARSFLLSLISDIASHRLLHEFGLSPANQIISSGGKFYLMLPNTTDSRDRIGRLQGEFDNWLMKNLNAELALNIAITEFSGKDLSDFDGVLKRVNQELNRVKNMPFANHLASGARWQEERFVVSHSGFGNEESLCKGCGKFAGQQRKNDVVLCEHCNMDKELGRELASAAGVQFFRSPGKGGHNIFGYSFSILKNGETPAVDSYLVSQFNDWSFRHPGAPIKPRYFANHLPRFKRDTCNGCDARDCSEKGGAELGNPKFFTCLAQASRGKKALGVFKADVDNLGLVFINGFGGQRGKSDKSISRITTLSRLLDTFFTGRLDYLLKTDYSDIYTVFAGGDDLLVIGPWDRIVEFSLRLRKEFEEYCCHNPDFTLSAGIAIVKPRLPIYAAIEMAEELLEKSKKHAALGEQEPKDQLSVMGDCFRWSDAGGILSEAERLAKWYEQRTGGLSSGMIYQLLDASERYRKFRLTGETGCLNFVPMLSYAINRNIKPSEQSLVSWLHELTDLKSANLKHLEFIANYALTTNRS